MPSRATTKSTCGARRTEGRKAEASQGQRVSCGMTSLFQREESSRRGLGSRRVHVDKVHEYRF